MSTNTSTVIKPRGASLEAVGLTFASYCEISGSEIILSKAALRLNPNTIPIREILLFISLVSERRQSRSGNKRATRWLWARLYGRGSGLDDALRLHGAGDLQKTSSIRAKDIIAIAPILPCSLCRRAETTVRHTCTALVLLIVLLSSI